MVVATIFSFVAAGIALSFLSGIKLWNRAKNADFAKYQFLLELEGVARDLRQGIGEPDISFQGDAAAITFAELSGDSVYKVTYSFDADQSSLVRRQVALKYVKEKKEAEEYTEKRLSGWEGLSLSYFYYDGLEKKYIWVNEWSEEDGMFTAVKIQGQFKGEIYSRVVFIPTA
jgi:type II secretory pathway pseudopilin PulG